MYKYSIIIPVYNSQKFIENCIDSILKQTYTNYEIVLVNDGSTDSSLKICNKIANDHPEQIKVIDIPNGGTSKARNVGIKHASGDYIGFMDNDDFWKYDFCLNDINNQLEESEADVIIYPSVIYKEQTNEYIPKATHISRENIVGKEIGSALKVLIEGNGLWSAVWTKFVKRDIIFEHNIFFPENMRNEDTDWSAQLYRHIKSLDWYNVAFYAYRKGNSYAQTSKPLTKKHVDDLKKILIRNIDDVKSSNLTETHKGAIYDFLAYSYSVWLAQVCLFPEFRTELKQLKSYSFVLSYSSRTYLKLVNLSYHILGPVITGTLLKKALLKKYPFQNKTKKEN